MFSVTCFHSYSLLNLILDTRALFQHDDLAWYFFAWGDCSDDGHVVSRTPENSLVTTSNVNYDLFL